MSTNLSQVNPSWAWPELRGGPHFKIFVLFTDIRRTLAALCSAGMLAMGLNARIELIVPQIVPYPLPIDRPPVAPSVSTKTYKTIVEQSGIETSICVYLCRERRGALAAALIPGSIVVIGARRRWWPTREYRLGRWLRANGHRVIYVDIGSEVPEVSNA